MTSGSGNIVNYFPENRLTTVVVLKLQQHPDDDQTEMREILVMGERE